MLKRFLLVVCAFLIISACNPSPEQLTLTAVAAKTQTEKAAPTATLTPSPTLTPTFTPTLTPTATPTPTPLGGGSGVLIFVANSFYDRPPSYRDGIYTVNVDGSDLKQILSRPQIEAMIGKKYEDAGYRSHEGQHYIFADTLYSVTNDWKLVRKIDLPNFGRLYGFSPDGKYILWKDNYYTFVSSIDGLETKRLFGGYDYFTGVSADGSTVYYQKYMGSSEGAVDIDGSNKRELPMTALEDYQPYEGVPLEKGVVSRWRSPKRIDRYAVSPDKTQVAFTWDDLLFTADATDLEFSNLRFVAQLPERPMTLRWSPDGNYLLAGLYFCTVGSCNAGDVIVLINVQQNSIETIISSAEYKRVYPCGFSPDSHQVVFTYIEPFARSSWIVLSSVDGKSPPTRIRFGGYIDPYGGCPTWLSDN